MLRVACAAALLLGALPVLAAAEEENKEKTFRAQIKDVLGTDGTLIVTVGKGDEAKDRSLLIKDARFVGPDKSEIKVGDLRKGDLVEIEMTPDGKAVHEVRVLPPKEEK
jgi:hypothetical protein